MTFVEESLRSTAHELFAGPDRRLTLARLLDLGWDELAEHDLRSGVTALAEEQGRSRGESRLLELTMEVGLGRATDLALAALVVPLVTRPPNADDPGAIVRGVLLDDASAARGLTIALYGDGQMVLRRVDALAMDVMNRTGIDPDAGMVLVEGQPPPGEDVRLDPSAWDHAVALGSLALAHELLGITRAMLDLAVEHVSVRHQFGVPLGSFQAVQHRLADVLVGLEGARAITRTAWIDHDRFLCAAAWAAARRAFEVASEHCQQVLGAMGCTWEHDLQRYQRRGLLLEQLLDPGPCLGEALGSVVLEQRRTEVLA